MEGAADRISACNKFFRGYKILSCTVWRLLQGDSMVFEHKIGSILSPTQFFVVARIVVAATTTYSVILSVMHFRYAFGL